MEERDPGGDRLEHLAEADVAPARRARRARSEATRKTAAARIQPRGLNCVRCASAPATARTKLTIRGPQREAIESSIRTIVPVRTAATFLQPGRAATVCGRLRAALDVGEHDDVRARETTYSAESFG